jgi:hypothetical protein
MFFVDQPRSPKFVILFFALLLSSLTFWESKKIILWEEKTDTLGRNVFEGAVLVSANFFETLKEKMRLKEFFDREHFFWLRLKTSPILFATLSKSTEENINIVSGPQDITTKKEVQTSTTELGTKEVQDSTLMSKKDYLKKDFSFPKESLETISQNLEKKQDSKIQKENLTFSIEGEMRILIVGDSMVAVGGGLGEMLEKELKKEFPHSKILREGKVSSGLSRPDYFNWEARLNQLISQFNPSITILVFGLNDPQALTDSKGNVVVSYGKFGQREWEEEYGKRVRRIVEILNQEGSFVFWVGLPVVKNPNLANKLAILNQIYEKEVKKFEKGVFIPIWCVLCENERYTDYLPNENGIRQLVRTSDGVHFQYFGGKIVSRLIVKEIKNNLNL